MISAPRGRRRLYALLALLCCALLISAPAQEKKLSIYSPRGGYSIALAEREGKDYVALQDVLQPLGAVAMTIDGKKLNVSFTPAGTVKTVEAQFTEGKTAARVGSRNVELAWRFRLEGDRGMIPVRSLPPLLARIFDMQIEFHEPGRRLLIGNSGVHYSAELKRAPTRLVFSFSAPVSPSIATEPGGLHMVFTRDALVSANGPPQMLDDHNITAIRFSETNGAAELSVAANTALLANFSDGGRTITVTAATPAPPPATAAKVPAVPVLPPSAPPVPQGPRFAVIIDPGHGGSDSGAALGDMAEKDFNLALARRLRAELEGRGLRAVLLRDGDNTISLEQRAWSANGAGAGVYIAIHATAVGAGVRVYTSDVAPDRHAFLPFDRVQAARVERSSLLAGGIVAELLKRQIGAASLPAPVRPLNNVATAAVALEVAPPQTDAQRSAAAGYQQSICSAIGAALTSLRARLEELR